MSKERLRAAPLTAATSRYALLWLRLGTLFLYILFHVVLGDFPGLVRVVLVHALERLQRIGSEILLVNDSVGADNKCHALQSPDIQRAQRRGRTRRSLHRQP